MLAFFFVLVKLIKIEKELIRMNSIQKSGKMLSISLCDCKGQWKKKIRTIEEYLVIANKYLKIGLGHYRLNAKTSYQLNNI